MENNIFQNEVELIRLKLQGELLQEYEQPVYQRVIAGRSGLRLLDIGCNNGQKTVKRFRGESFSHVIGVDYLEEMAQQAQRQYGNEVFSFYACDVTAPDFIQKLRKIMEEREIEAFDVIHMSFLLMHLKEPGALLASLRSVLAPQGKLIMIEPDDSDSRIEPDTEEQYSEFIEMQLKNPYAGDRFCAKHLPRILSENGYDGIRLEHSGICAGEGELEKKQIIFSVFCSYFPEDIRILRKEEPENPVYRACEEWVLTHFETLRRKMLEKDTSIHMGIKIYTCGLQEKEI